MKGIYYLQQMIRIDETMSWYENLAVEHDRFRYGDYGINTREEFDKFYLHTL
jgi:hypothetical protein